MGGGKLKLLIITEIEVLVFHSIHRSPAPNNDVKCYTNASVYS